MSLLYWIQGSVTAARKTSSFMALATGDTEPEAIAKCAEALEKDWASFEIDTIRPIDPDLSFQVEPVLSEAIAFAQEEGVFLFVADSTSN